jgi:preprotein translocase subunit SecF
VFSFAEFGNDLYTGRRSYDFVGRRRLWYTIAAVLVIGSIVVLLVKGLNAGIEFRGGSEFRVTGVEKVDETIAERVVSETVAGAETPRASIIGNDSVRVQTEQLSDSQTNELRSALAEAYGVSDSNVTSSFVGPSWGQDVSEKALRALVIFLVLVSLVIALYFRTWKMAVGALVALLHDVIITVGVYALVGFEVTPATVIGFLTILGFSLYDTVVVFDKVRENTEHVMTSTRRTFAEQANLAVNQTLVRSINTSVVALLPVASILFIGSFLLGAGTLKDLSLALFIGTAAGTYSSVFIATPLYVHLRTREPDVQAQAARVEARRAADARKAAAGDDTPAETPSAVPSGQGTATAVLERTPATTGTSGTGTSGAAAPAGRARGPRNQPRRNNRNRRGRGR